MLIHLSICSYVAELVASPQFVYMMPLTYITKHIKAGLREKEMLSELAINLQLRTVNG